MGTALLMSFISYLYLQWPMLIYPIKMVMIICFVLLVTRFAFHMYLITDEGKKIFGVQTEKITMRFFQPNLKNAERIPESC